MQRLELWRTVRGHGVTLRDLLSWFQIEGPPVPLIGMAQGLGLRVYYRPNASCDGLLSFAEGGPYLFLKKELSLDWQRFTTALALGFLVCNSGEEAIRINAKALLNSCTDHPDVQLFALELALPTWMVNFALSHMNLTYSELAALFHVPYPALGLKLRHLDVL